MLTIQPDIHLDIDPDLSFLTEAFGGMWTVSTPPLNNRLYIGLQWYPGAFQGSIGIGCEVDRKEALLLSRAKLKDLFIHVLMEAADTLVESKYRQDQEQFWKDWFARRTPEELVKLDTWMAREALPELPWGYCRLDYNKEDAQVLFGTLAAVGMQAGASIVPSFRINPVEGTMILYQGSLAQIVYSGSAWVILVFHEEEVDWNRRIGPGQSYVKWVWKDCTEWDDESAQCPVFNSEALPYQDRHELQFARKERHYLSERYHEPLPSGR
jgi:hypothetical protein